MSSEELLNQPHNNLNYKLTVTDQDGEVIREMQALISVDNFDVEKKSTLKALLAFFNKVQREPSRVVPRYTIFKGEQV
jgi:hypothetical protein